MQHLIVIGTKYNRLYMCVYKRSNSEFDWNHK